MQKLMKRALCVLVCALLLAGLAMPAFASGYDPEAVCELTVNFQDKGKPIEGASFSVYRVAAFNGAIFTKTESFAASGVELNGIETNEQWLAAAKTLADFVSVRRIDADAGKKTDAYGKAVFSELEAGLYLIVGQTVYVDRTSYSPTPVLICLPNRIDDTWDSNVSSQTKYTSQYHPPLPPTPVDDTVEHKALKVWDDADGFADRPASITVYLLRNHEVFDTVTLDESSDWRYHWRGLPRYDKQGFEYDWTVSEEPVEGYTTLVSDQGITSVITNTRKAAEPVVEPEPEPELPNTGLLWWPVPVLFMAGLALVAVGLIVRKKQKA